MSKSKIRAGKAEVELGVKSNIEKGLKAARKRFNAFGASLTKIGGGVLGIGAGILGALTPAVLKASEFQETMGKFNVVFGEQSKAMKKWGDDYSAEVGRSKSETAKFLAGFQDLLVPIGVDPNTAMESSKVLTQLSVDLASFNNMADADVSRDLQAALTGSSEVMKKYGVVVNETAVKQKLLADGMDPKNATEAQKAMARLNIILAGTTAAQGDAKRTSGSFANQMKALQSSFSDMLVEVGTPLLDFLAGLAGHIRGAINFVSNWVQQNQGLVKVLALVAVGLAVAGGAVAALGLAFTVAGMAITGVLAVINLFTGGIGLLVGVIAALTAGVAVGLGFLLAYTVGFENLMPVVDAVKDAIGGISDAISAGDWGLAGKIAISGLKLAIGEGLNAIFGDWKTWVDNLVDSFLTGLENILTAFASMAGKVSTWLQDMLPANKLGATAKAFIAATGAATTAGIGGITGGIDDLKKNFKSFTGELQDTDGSRRELDELIAKAGQAKDDAQKARETAAQAGAQIPEIAIPNGAGAGVSQAKANLASFSVASLNAQLGKKDRQKEIADATKKTAENTEELVRADRGGLLIV